MIRTVLVIALLAIGSTQASAQSLVGKWDCEGREGRGTAIRTLQEYRANGSFYHLANMAVGDRRGRIDASVALRGKWTTSGSTLVEDITTVRMRSLQANSKDISRTPIGRQMARTLPQRMAGPKNGSRTKIKFISAREFRMVSGRIRGKCIKR
ncbi:hypothetical protein [uncultured Sulfitobacter sp.]|nr:hypothetical protein [uncultured Sulfitobacter sp.]